MSKIFYLLPLACASFLQAQTPTITGVSAQPFASSVLCPGDQVVVNGTNLGTTSTVVKVGAKNAFVKNAAANGTQLVVQIPVDAPLGATTVTAGASTPFGITLSQFAPALLHDSTNTMQGFHVSNGAAISATSPVSPGETIGVTAFGLGPTNPALPTGIAASAFNVNTTTTPTATFAGKPATVSSAALAQGQVAVYIVYLTVRADAGSGFQSLTITMGGVTSNSVFVPISTAPVVSQIVNAGSYTPQTLPGAEIAQGAIFVIKGILMGPGTIALAANAFQVTTVGGTTVNIKAGSTSIALPLYYSLAGQIAALLPSSVPTGGATLSVTYGGQTSADFPFTIVANQLGIFTTSSDGQGAGIVTYPDYSLVSATKAANCGGPSTTCGAANPGDVLTLWATGLGPISGNDVKGDGLGVDMTSVPLKLFIGGVAATVVYRGRGCCIGEDQIAFTVPDNVPTGCAVPMYAAIGNTVSNFVVMPVAAKGSRTCPGTSEILTPASVAQLTSNAPTTFADLHLAHGPTFPGYDDEFYGNFIKTAFPPFLQAFIPSYVDRNPLGTCMVYPSGGTGLNPPFVNPTLLDGGAKLTIKGPNGTVTAGSGGNDEFDAVLSSKGTYLTPGTYTISAPGGADIPAFSIDYPIPVLPVMTSPVPDAANAATVTRASGMTVTWSGGSAGVYVELHLAASTDAGFNNAASVDCFADSTLHSFTIPATILSTLPATNYANVDFVATPVSVVSNTIAGLNLAIVSSEFHSVATLNIK